MAKQLKYDVDARDALARGVDVLANAVEVKRREQAAEDQAQELDAQTPAEEDATDGGDS